MRIKARTRQLNSITAAVQMGHLEQQLGEAQIRRLREEMAMDFNAFFRGWHLLMAGERKDAAADLLRRIRVHVNPTSSSSSSGNNNIGIQLLARPCDSNSAVTAADAPGISPVQQQAQQQQQQQHEIAADDKFDLMMMIAAATGIAAHS
jgi:hypothetical protein